MAIVTFCSSIASNSRRVPTRTSTSVPGRVLRFDNIIKRWISDHNISIGSSLIPVGAKSRLSSSVVGGSRDKVAVVGYISGILRSRHTEMILWQFRKLHGAVDASISSMAEAVELTVVGFFELSVKAVVHGVGFGYTVVRVVTP